MKPKDATHKSKLNGMYYKQYKGSIFYFDEIWEISRVTNLNTEYFEVLK